MKQSKKLLASFLILSMLISSGCASKSESQKNKHDIDDTSGFTVPDHPTKPSELEETQETTVEVTETTAEPIPEETTPTEEVTPTPEPTVEDEYTPFERNEAVFTADGTSTFGNLTDEEFEMFKELFEGSYAEDSCLIFQEDAETKDVGIGYYYGCYDKPEDVNLDYCIPYPADESHLDGEYCDPYFIPVDRVDSDIYNRIGVHVSDLTNDQLTSIEYEGEECYIFDCGTGAPGAYISSFTLMGGLRIDDDFYLYLGGSAWHIEGFAILHVVDENGEYKIKGCRFVESWEDATNVLSHNELITRDYLASQLDARLLDTSDFYYHYRNPEEYVEIMDFKYTLIRDSYLAYQGVIFEDPFIQTYFESRSWYEGKIPEADFDTWYTLNEYDLLNMTEAEKLLMDIDSTLETFYQEEIKPMSSSGIDAEFTFTSSWNDDGFALEGDPLTGIDGTFGHLISDFDGDGTQELMVFGLTQVDYEPEESDRTSIALNRYATSYYRLTVDLYCYIGDDITLTDTYTHYMYDPEDEYTEDSAVIRDKSDINTNFYMYLASGDSGNSVVIYCLESTNGLTGDGQFDSFAELNVVDNKFNLKTQIVQDGLGSDNNTYNVYTFTDGEETSQTHYGYEDMFNPFEYLDLESDVPQYLMWKASLVTAGLRYSYSEYLDGKSSVTVRYNVIDY